MIKDNIFEIRKRVSSACARVNRSPEDVAIIAVSKGRDIQEIQEAVAAGIIDIGENRVQEAILKVSQFDRPTGQPANRLTIKWHMIGHLQTNKVKEAVKIFDLIQSVDSVHLAEAINKEAAKINKIQDILFEVKTSPEETKFGLKPDEAAKAIKDITQLKNVRIKGLMAIAPAVDNPGEARQYFRTLRELKDRINGLQPFPRLRSGQAAYSLELLSMGMTDDFEVAIEEGANMVRLGRAIFEGWKAE